MFKKLAVLSVTAALMAAMLVPTVASASPSGIPDDAGDRIYKFNIIGVDNVKDADMTGDNGKRIFVPLKEKCKILLTQAMEEDGLTPMPVSPEAFDIIDANGTDGEAILQLPAPGYEPYIIGETAEAWSDYSIYIRSLGKPDGFTTITTCAELINQDALFNMLPNADQKEIKNAEREAAADGHIVYASVEQVGQSITERPHGKSDFTNVTAELTSIVFEIELTDDLGNVIDTYQVRVPIFDSMLEGEYWEYDNSGLKLLQVWIYDGGTNVAEEEVG